jgi:hypothetical protein
LFLLKQEFPGMMLKDVIDGYDFDLICFFFSQISQLLDWVRSKLFASFKNKAYGWGRALSTPFWCER